MDGFTRWWAAWPRSPRKGGRADCLKKWKRSCYEAQADEIIRHTEWMASTPDWRKNGGEFVPMPKTYLNQQRWDGAEMVGQQVIEAPSYRPTAAEMRVMQACPGIAAPHLRQQVQQPFTIDAGDRDDIKLLG